MSRFHSFRLSISIILTIFCIDKSFASPVAVASGLRPRISIVAAYEPVHIIPVDNLPPSGRFLSGGGGGSDGVSITDDGTTQLTTYNVPRDPVQKRRDSSNSRASEPVNIIPADEFSPGQLPPHGSSSTTNDGTTVTTTFTNPRTLGQNKQTNYNDTNGLQLVSPTNQSLAVSELELGLNCQGSVVMCAGAAQMGVMHTLRDYMYAIPTGYRYYSGQNIACMKHTFYPNPWITWGFYCAFMQGNVPGDGVDGAEIQLKMQQMIEHHCLGCGSVPFSDDNDPNTHGILTVNYVRQSECEGLCYYVPPGTPSNAVQVPQGMHLVS